jgi:hypothetical protein
MATGPHFLAASVKGNVESAPTIMEIKAIKQPKPAECGKCINEKVHKGR